MLIDRIVLISAWVVTILLLILLTPRDKIREAHVLFMFKQVLTWITGLIVVEAGWIEYPVREFPKASASSFSFEYFIFPAVCIILVLRFPFHKSIWHKTGWLLLFPTGMTILEVLIERYTNLIKYINWSWYWSWLSLLLFDIITLCYYLWFIKKGTGKTSV
jgi:hypothetical protein